MSLGLSHEQAIELVSHSTISTAQRGGGALDGIFDASDRAEEGGVIVWWNDIEKDERYVIHPNRERGETQNINRYEKWNPSLHMVCPSSEVYLHISTSDINSFSVPSTQANSTMSKGTCSTLSSQ